jgi:hypothetical protein
LIEDKGQWRAVVSTVMCFQIAWKARDFLTRWAIVISSMRTQLHEVSCLVQFFPNDYTCWICSAYDLHSEGAGFVSRPRDRLHWYFSWVFSVYSAIFPEINSNRQRLLLSTSFPIHCSRTMLTFDIMNSEILTASLNIR